MSETQDLPFKRTRGEWALSIGLFAGSILLFLAFYPATGFKIGDKFIIYLNCLVLFFLSLGFYRTFLKPHAFRFTEDGMLVVESLLLPKVLPVARIGSVILGQTQGRKGPRTTYTIQLKDGDPVEIPALGDMALFLEKLKALNPGMTLQDDRTPKK